MAYRTYINDKQLFGNNEYYERWINYIKSQGIEVDDEEGRYDGELTDFMGALQVIEEITWDLYKEREEERKQNKRLPGLFNLSPDMARIEKTHDNLFDWLMNVTNNCYCMLPYTFFKCCEPHLVRETPFIIKDRGYCYKLMEGRTIHIHAS